MHNQKLKELSPSCPLIIHTSASPLSVRARQHDTVVLSTLSFLWTLEMLGG
jgi:hypothetical protein